MKLIYTTLLEILKPINSLKWIDLEKSQLETSNRPDVDFPCALIDIDITQCNDLGAKKQLCTASVGIRIAVQTFDATAAHTPEEHRQKSLEYFDLVDEVYNALQGYYDNHLSRFSRKRTISEKRDDSLKVTTIFFETEFISVIASEAI